MISDPTDPVTVIGGSMGNAAATVAGDAFDAAGEKIWTFASTLLSGAFRVIDTYASPNVDPTSGPLTGILPITLWVGGGVLILLTFMQLGAAVLSGGRGFGTLLIGLGQYVVISAGGLAFLAVLVAASNGLASGILQGGLNVDSWAGVNGHNSAWENSAHSAGGVAVGLIGLFCVIPAALGFLLESLVRYAAILVLAATTPILAAGLVFETTARWFWTALRWMISLLLLTPALALVTVIGMQVAASSAGSGNAVATGSGGGSGAAVVGMAVGALILLVALLCPLVMFRLLAFIDPNTVSGGAIRGFFSGSAVGATVAGGSRGSAGVEAAESATEARFGSALAGVSGVGGRAADGASQHGTQVLDSLGVGGAAASGARGGSADSGPGAASEAGEPAGGSAAEAPAAGRGTGWPSRPSVPSRIPDASSSPGTGHVSLDEPDETSRTVTL